MQFIVNILKRFIKDEKKILGRWNIEYCNKKVNNKIDLSNKLIYILNNPMLVVESEGQSEAEKNITYKLMCEEYQNTFISILNRVFSSDYIVKFHCSTRVLLKELNIDVILQLNSDR